MRKAQYGAVVFTIVTSLFGGTSAVQADTFEDYIERLGQHPQVLGVLAETEALKHQAKGELGLPDPTLFIGVDNVPISDPAFDRFLPSSKVIGFTQKIPNPAIRKAKSARFTQMSAKSRLMAEYTNARLRFMLIAKLAEYKSVKTQIDLLHQQLGYYQELENTFKGQIASGRSVYQRFSEVDVERAEAERKLNDLEAKLVSIEAEFVRLVEEVPAIEVPIVPVLSWHQDPLALYPIAIAAEDINIAEKGVDIANADFLPNFGLSATYKQRESSTVGAFAGDDWFSVQLQMSIPLWAHSSQYPRLKAAKERKRSASLNFEDMRRAWLREMISIQNNRDAAAKNVEVLKSKGTAMEEKIEAAQRNYEAGTENLDAVLLAKIDHLNILAQLAVSQEALVRRSAEFNSNLMDSYEEVSE